jgi:hypothetical protein
MSLDHPRFLDVAQFTKVIHHSRTPTTDPKLVRLPAGFSVCVIGASSGIGEHIAYAYAHAQASSIVIASGTPLISSRWRSGSDPSILLAQCE